MIADAILKEYNTLLKQRNQLETELKPKLLQVELLTKQLLNLNSKVINALIDHELYFTSQDLKELCKKHDTSYLNSVMAITVDREVIDLSSEGNELCLDELGVINYCGLSFPSVRGFFNVSLKTKDGIKVIEETQITALLKTPELTFLN